MTQTVRSMLLLHRALKPKSKQEQLHNVSNFWLDKVGLCKITCQHEILMSKMLTSAPVEGMHMLQVAQICSHI